MMKGPNVRVRARIARETMKSRTKLVIRTDASFRPSKSCLQVGISDEIRNKTYGLPKDDVVIVVKPAKSKILPASSLHSTIATNHERIYATT